MGDDLVWMDLTSLAEEKYPDPKKRWIEIQESTLNFVLVCMQLEYERWDPQHDYAEADCPYEWHDITDLITKFKTYLEGGENNE